MFFQSISISILLFFIILFYIFAENVFQIGMQINTEEYINSGKRETDDVLGNAKFNANQKYGNYGITPLMKLTVQAQVTRVYFAVEFRTPPPPPLRL